MKTKITFHNMPHSVPMEAHALQKLEKISEFLKNIQDIEPLYAELWLKANKQHPHHASELHIKTPFFDLHTHDEGADMYIVIDSTIDKMVKLIKKEKERFRDKVRKPLTAKKEFLEESYSKKTTKKI
jgi:ribosomal subunit interface protein